MLNPVIQSSYGTGNGRNDSTKECESSNDNDTSSPKNLIANSGVTSLLAVLPQDDVEHEKSNNSIGKWVNADKRRKNESEPYPQNSYLRKYYSGKDKNLPKDLKELFTPLKCNLCRCSMSSTVTAKDHYEGKKHISNIKKWLLEHPQYNDIFCLTDANRQKIIDPDKLYCKYCDLMMSSEQQAQSHYIGKKHQGMINSGMMKNAWFNPITGQWERSLINETDSRFGFLNKDNIGKDITPNQRFYCETCQVACPSQITFNDHLAGAKHKKKMMLFLDYEPSPATKDNILEDVIKGEKKTTSPADLSIYRTPSGKYYCHSCNVTVNSPIQFLQHSESRKHKHKSSSSTNKLCK